MSPPAEPESPVADFQTAASPPSRWFAFRFLPNWISLVGAVLFGTTMVTFCFLLLVEYLTGHPGPYLGLFHYLLLPPLGTLGLVIFGIGLWLERRRLRLGVAAKRSFLAFDVTRPEVQQRVLLLAGGLSAVSVFVMTLGGYRAYEFSESVVFCGEICHAVMDPEYTAYQRSPHARVECVACHVGRGPEHYLSAKMRGVYQVYSAFAETYPRPIPTPIESLRPARETCERCHWPSYQFGKRRKVYTYYASEGGEGPWTLEMLVDIGAGDPETGPSSGIHWHMDLANVVEYIARDEARQDIPWVRLTDSEGNVTVYENVEDPSSEELQQEDVVRMVDCLDCHNRPAHRFGSPVVLVNRELAEGNLNPAMPEIKLMALEILASEFDTREAAEQAIPEQIHSFYAEEYPDYHEEHGSAIDEAAAVLTHLYRSHVFPEMKVRWDAYPDNSSHWISPGCFRCHDGLHRSRDGRVISASCDTCHTILSQGTVGRLQQGGPGLPFVHPWDEEVMDESIRCTECHDGALGF